MSKIVRKAPPAKFDSNDRRVARTRRLLGDALVGLILERKYDSITVQEILDRANVGRSTFYTYYFDKDDLLASVFESVLDSLAEQSAQVRTGVPFVPSLALFQHVASHYALYEAVVMGSGLEILHARAYAYVVARVERQLAEHPASANPTIPAPVVSNFVAGTLSNLLAWWLENRMPYSPERMDEIFQELVAPAFRTSSGNEFK